MGSETVLLYFFLEWDTGIVGVWGQGTLCLEGVGLQENLKVGTV